MDYEYRMSVNPPVGVRIQDPATEDNRSSTVVTAIAAVVACHMAGVASLLDKTAVPWWL